MIICPRCHTQNPDGAVQCRYCGLQFQQIYAMQNQQVPPFPVTNSTEINNLPSQKNSKNKKRLNKIEIILLCLCVLLAISNGVILYIYLSSENHQYREAYMDLQKTMLVDWGINELKQIPGTVAAINGYGGTENTDLTPAPEVLPFSIGNKLHFDFMDFSLEKIEWTDDIMPHTARCDSRIYTHYEKKANETYLSIWGTVKNLSGDNISLDNIEAEFVFNDKYTYSGHISDEDDDHCGFGSSYIKPLRATEFVLFVSVPEEVKTIYENAVLTFGFNNNLKRTYGDISEKEYLYRMEIR